ncbi:MAG: hypothetical protein A3E84_05870 [Gammaproteobacteria bacterium RIFCSPHIGHO2_12_FULL_42_13]|nr:MAG: hypothetical protein A3E84_05870 [Gammaproteobacteria bacterium RIFCSPHIGHO2_12_FULL_42_13]
MATSSGNNQHGIFSNANLKTRAQALAQKAEEADAAPLLNALEALSKLLPHSDTEKKLSKADIQALLGSNDNTPPDEKDSKNTPK